MTKALYRDIPLDRMNKSRGIRNRWCSIFIHTMDAGRKTMRNPPDKQQLGL